MAWNAITGLLMLAFAFQSYLTQTHIHGLPQTGANLCITKCVTNAPAKSAQPSGDTSDCPMCQAIVHAGFFSFATPPVVVISGLWVEFSLPMLKKAASHATVSPGWQSRAPPIR